jgi:hypothetical protein
LANAQFEQAKQLTDFLTKHATASGLIEFGYYGDWLNIGNVPAKFVNSFAHVLAVTRLAELAEALNRTQDALHYGALEVKLKQAFHTKYFQVAFSISIIAPAYRL